MKDVTAKKRVRDGGGALPPVPELRDRINGLDAAVVRLRRELAGYPRPLPDRAVAEDALGALGACAAEPAQDAEQLQHFLLLAVSALGSVSALTTPLEALREAVEELAAPS